MKVQVVPHDPNWSAEFMAEATRIRSALDDMVVAIHHIGSTAIRGICAKPIIDILLEVDDIQKLEARSAALGDLGYEAKGEFGIPGRRYFRKESPVGVRTHHVHAFGIGDAAIERHLAFRDYMIAHPDIAQSYSLLKQRLAEAHPDDIEAYMDGKDAFIKEHEAEAIVWKREVQRHDPVITRDLDEDFPTKCQ
jgi:GrpB-like predicted nucleotidyltransferase (UPF0157 family)